MARLIGFYRRISAVPSAALPSTVLLVAANLVPLVGVLFLGWSLWTILVLYWLENGVIGFFNVLKMAAARGSAMGPAMGPAEDAAAGSAGSAAGPASSAAGSAESRWHPTVTVRRWGKRPVQMTDGPALARAFLIPFFCLHYGIFWLVHGIFVWAIPLFASASFQTGPAGGIASGGVDAFGPPPSLAVLVLGLVTMAIRHGASYRMDFIGTGEYLHTSPASLLFMPYARVVVLHLTIVLGAVAAFVLDSPVWMLATLVLVKTAIDLAAHLVGLARSERHARLSLGPQASTVGVKPTGRRPERLTPSPGSSRPR